MEILSLQFLSALGAIILIDLALAGDNAIVIGLAVRKLPLELQRRAVFWGALGAVAVRALLTTAVLWLLQIPGFLLAGGLALLWIAYRMLSEDGGAPDSASINASANLRYAIQTIIVADTIMGMENVLAVAGAAHGSILLVISGLIISIPIIMLGSMVILKWVERYPVIVVLGAAVLGWTAAKMITSESLLSTFFTDYPVWKIVVYAFSISIILLVPVLRKLRGRITSLPVCLGFQLLWLSTFDYIEEHTMQHYFTQGGAPLSIELIDLVMWLGWIPFVMMLDKEISSPDPSKPCAAPCP